MANKKKTKSKGKSFFSKFSPKKLTALVIIVAIAVVGAHLILETHADSNTTYNLNAPPVAIANNGTTDGYWIGASDGGVFSQGTATFYGSSPSIGDVTAMAATPDDKGYYLLGANGAVFAYGDAKYAGGLNDYNGANILVSGAKAIGIAARTGGGYWIIDNEGHTYAFGGAPSFGYNPTGYSGSIIGIAADGAGTGYFAVSSHGQDYALGGAGDCGNTASTTIVGVTAASSGTSGCWMVSSGGGVYAYGAAYYGSIGQINPNEAAGGSNSVTLNAPIVGIVHTSDYKGYWLVASDGGVFAFGDAAFEGRVVYNPPTASLTSSTTKITDGQSATLSWTTANATSASITNVGAVNAASGSSVSVSPSVTTTYVLSVGGPGGTAPTSQVTITVVPKPAAPASSPTASSAGSGNTSTGTGGASPSCADVPNSHLTAFGCACNTGYTSTGFGCILTATLAQQSCQAGKVYVRDHGCVSMASAASNTPLLTSANGSSSGSTVVSLGTTSSAPPVCTNLLLGCN